MNSIMLGVFVLMSLCCTIGSSEAVKLEDIDSFFLSQVAATINLKNEPMLESCAHFLLVIEAQLSGGDLMKALYQQVQPSELNLTMMREIEELIRIRGMNHGDDMLFLRGCTKLLKQNGAKEQPLSVEESVITHDLQRQVLRLREDYLNLKQQFNLLNKKYDQTKQQPTKEE